MYLINEIKQGRAQNFYLKDANVCLTEIGFSKVNGFSKKNCLLMKYYPYERIQKEDLLELLLIVVFKMECSS